MTQIPMSILMETIRRYFTISCKIFTAFAINTDVNTDGTCSSVFYRECKIFTAFATITNAHTEGLWLSVFYRELQNIYCPCQNHRWCFRWTLHFPMRVTIRVLGRSMRIQTTSPTDTANSNARALTPLYRRTSKILEGFLKF